jgi:type I restriction enzyme, S subunit
MKPTYKLIGDVIEPQPKKYKIKKSYYLDSGKFPVIDQGEDYIAGFINDFDKTYDGPLPVIVFGDHTCRLKYIPFKFAVGADGTQLIRPTNDFDIRYFYYALIYANPEQFGYQRHFKLLKTKYIAWFPLPIQKNIASILSLFDDLIENNTRRIQILEEIAQLIYREWFVHYRFPGYEHVKMMDSGTEFGEIPEGWELIKVNDLLLRTPTKKKIKKGDYLEKGLIPIIDQGSDYIGGYTNDNEAIITENLPLIVFGDHTRILKLINFPFARGADGTQLICSKNKRMPNSLFYLSLVNIDLSNYGYARHFKFLKDKNIIVPNQNISDIFDLLISPMYDLIKNLHNRTVLLIDARDILLPKLISGEIDVSELEIETA